VTQSGRRVCSFILAVNRNYGKTDYLPCVAWGRIATYILKIGIGSSIGITGRFQSREYTKENVPEVKTAYEVSISSAQFAE
jgi:single-stranded DNA-binding protein